MVASMHVGQGSVSGGAGYNMPVRGLCTTSPAFVQANIMGILCSLFVQEVHT